ncbi:MAG: Fe-S cluster assembly protein SufD [Micrococcales bacterium]
MATPEVLDNNQQPHSHGYTSEADIPVQLRAERLKSTDPKDFPAISNREETWRYTTSEQLRGLDTEALSEFIGDFELKAEPVVKTRWISPDHELFGIAGTPEDLPSANAWAAAQQAYLIDIPSTDIGEEVTLTIKSETDDPTALHLVINAQTHSNATLIIDHKGRATIAENVEINVSDEANLTVVTIQDWDDTAVHTSAIYAKLGRNATLKHVVVTLGGKVVRVTPNAVFTAPGSSVELLGLYYADAGQHMEHRLFVDHAVPNCKSRVTYKGALQGDKAHTIWVGDVLIRKAAEGTDTYELNRNLLLTDGARADSVPNLEIETGQIEGAGHASASGRFDDEQLFYLQARGITESEARRLVVRGFLHEIIQQIPNLEVQEKLNQTIEAELARSNS